MKTAWSYHRKWWHQHFNASDRPARYLALRAFGSKKYQGAGKQYQPSLDRKKGGSQIEYADEEPIVREWFHEALAKRGAQSSDGETVRENLMKDAIDARV